MVIYQLLNPQIELIVDYCHDLLSDEKLEVYDFGINGDLVLHIYKDEDYNPDVSSTSFDIVRIITMQNGENVDDTEDIYVTDGSLYMELERINKYRKYALL